MAVVRPFRALRYDPAVAGPLDSLVAPPYDVIGPEQREELLGRSPYNVVHLTLPDSEEEAAASLADWQERGVLVREERAGLLVARAGATSAPTASARAAAGSSRRFGSSRTRTASSCRTSGRTRARRRAGCGSFARRAPSSSRSSSSGTGTVELDGLGEPELEALDEQRVSSWLWRLDAEFTAALVEELADAQLLIADGHHRYETALAFHEEDGTEAGLAARSDRPDRPGRAHDLSDAPGRAERRRRFGHADQPAGREPARTGPLSRRGATSCSRGDGFLDPEVVDRFGPSGVTYTPHREEAIATVDRGDAEAAFLLRPTKIEDVWEVARRGEVMPQKSTFFYPKLTSGLLMLPLD